MLGAITNGLIIGFSAVLFVYYGSFVLFTIDNLPKSAKRD